MHRQQNLLLDVGNSLVWDQSHNRSLACQECLTYADFKVSIQEKKMSLRQVLNAHAKPFCLKKSEGTEKVRFTTTEMESILHLEKNIPSANKPKENRNQPSKKSQQQQMQVNNNRRGQKHAK